MSIIGRRLKWITKKTQFSNDGRNVNVKKKHIEVYIFFLSISLTNQNQVDSYRIYTYSIIVYTV